MTIKVERMERPEASGDWHDAPSRWRVIGPNDELQKFSTRDNARVYARLRRQSVDTFEATHLYCSK